MNGATMFLMAVVMVGIGVGVVAALVLDLRGLGDVIRRVRQRRRR